MTQEQAITETLTVASNAMAEALYATLLIFTITLILFLAVIIYGHFSHKKFLRNLDRELTKEYEDSVKLNKSA